MSAGMIESSNLIIYNLPTIFFTRATGGGSVRNYTDYRHYQEVGYYSIAPPSSIALIVTTTSVAS